MGAPESVEEKTSSGTQGGRLLNDNLSWSLGPESDFVRMINQTLKKKRKPSPDPPSGHEWSGKLEDTEMSNDMLPQLRTLNVLIKAEAPDFVEEFIESLGIDHLCRLATGSGDVSADIELLRVMDRIVNRTENALKSVVEHHLSIRIVVEKIDSDDIAVSELALSSLVRMAGVGRHDISVMARDKIASSLQDLAVSKGQRNKYRTLISKMSINELTLISLNPISSLESRPNFCYLSFCSFCRFCRLQSL